jgi:hypothetical protein
MTTCGDTISDGDTDNLSDDTKKERNDTTSSIGPDDIDVTGIR